MYCPKCGTNNLDDVRFCRSCGTAISNVPAALANPAANAVSHGAHAGQSNDPDELYSGAIKAIISGVGFVVIALVLLFTGVAGGKAWWWAMLFPAITFLAKGFSDMARSRRLERARSVAVAPAPAANTFQPPRQAPELTQPAAHFAAPAESRYKTGDLVPPSVTDETTRHLQMDNEGETMTLPKKPV